MIRIGVIRIAVGMIDRFSVPAFDGFDMQLVDRGDIDHGLILFRGERAD